MEQKKSSKADLENKKGIFFMVGLVVALGLTLLAFDWTGRPSKAETFGPVQTQAIEDEYIPITREPEVKPPVPPPVQTVEILNIVDNNTDIKDELKIEATDVTDNTIFDVTPIIQPKEEEEEKEQIYFNSVEEPAEFPGGEKALTKYIKDHVNYPMIAAENGVEGRVIIQFVVNEEVMLPMLKLSGLLI